MGAQIETFTDTKPSFTDRKLFRVMAGIISFLTNWQKAMIFLGVICLVISVAQGDEAGPWYFGRCIVVSLLKWLIYRQLNEMMIAVKNDEPGFFSSQVKRLHTICFVLIAFMVVGFGFSVAQTLAAYHGAGFSVDIAIFSIGGFPAESIWNDIFHGDALEFPGADISRYSVVPRYATLNIGPLYIAGLVWVLSLVFQYGAWLQHEDEMTV